MKVKVDRKITANLPVELLIWAMDASGEGLTSTLRRGLEWVAVQKIFKQILNAKGKYPKGIGLDLEKSREDKDR